MYAKMGWSRQFYKLCGKVLNMAKVLITMNDGTVIEKLYTKECKDRDILFDIQNVSYFEQNGLYYFKENANNVRIVRE